MITNFSGQVVNGVRIIDYETTEKISECEARIEWYIETINKGNHYVINLKVEKIKLTIITFNDGSERDDIIVFPSEFISVYNIDELPTGKEIRPQLITYKDGGKFIEIGF
jgi:glycine cleavage system aminomethyltransferase T